MWWGKIIGGIFGALFAGPIGAVLGVIIGNTFDGGLKRWETGSFQFGSFSHQEQTQIQQAFFKATFAVMGHVAKSDGRVSEHEIAAARSVMRNMRLNEHLKQQAISCFNAGKQRNFNLDQELEALVEACHRQQVLIQMFVEIQYQAALAEGILSPQKSQVLQYISRRLGYTPFNFGQFQEQFRTYSGQSKTHYYQENPQTKLKEAYTILEISEGATQAEVKRAYRRLMSQNHPDKLVAKGLPDGMMKLATEKTQKIKAAYELIKETKGW